LAVGSRAERGGNAPSPTFATVLFKRGEHPKKFQALLGHSSITQTMDTYPRPLDDIEGDAVGGLDEVFEDTQIA
jgi:hypothetical protein